MGLERCEFFELLSSLFFSSLSPTTTESTSSCGGMISLFVVEIVLVVFDKDSENDAGEEFDNDEEAV